MPAPNVDRCIDFIELAKYLQTSLESLEEAKIRSAVGRLYYGTFNMLKDRFTRCNHVKYQKKRDLTKKENIHGTVKGIVANLNSTMTHHIHLLRELRNICDYDMSDINKGIDIKLSDGTQQHFSDLNELYVEAYIAAQSLWIYFTNNSNCQDMNDQYSMLASTTKTIFELS